MVTIQNFMNAFFKILNSLRLFIVYLFFTTKKRDLTVFERAKLLLKGPCTFTSAIQAFHAFFCVNDLTSAASRESH